MPEQALERIEYSRPAELGGVEVMQVEQVARRWSVFHETYSICTVLDAAGEAEFTYRGKLHCAKAGQILLMEPGEVHANTRITPCASFRVLFVPRAVLAQAAGAIGLDCSAPHWSCTRIDHPAFFRAFAELHAGLEGEATSLERESRFAACLALLLEHCAEAGCPRSPPGQGCGRNLQRCREFLVENYSQRLTLDQLAQVSALSRYHLVRAFGKAFGLAPHRYQLHVRIQKACGLLAQGMPAASVASETGFVDQSHLGHHFMNILGVTPGQYARA